jgi:hypothetical protein
MTAKEKAKELVEMYKETIVSFLSDEMKLENAKQCALVAVKMNISEAILWYGELNEEMIKYWEEVKNEIQNKDL